MVYGYPHPYRGPNIENKFTLGTRLVLFLKFISLCIFGMVVGMFFQQGWAVPPMYQAIVSVAIYFVIDMWVFIFGLVVIGFRR